jgi:hypothetical protein
MTLDELTITLSGDGGRLSVETLKDALDNALDMLRGLESEFVSAGVDVRWEVIRATMKSPFKITFMPRVPGKSGGATGRKIVKACLQGIDTIEHSPTPPKHFTDEVLEAARKLVKTAKKDGASVVISSNGKNQVALTTNSIKNIDEIISKARTYTDLSTIEGRLEVISVHEGFSCVVWETLTNQRIECLMDEESFREILKYLNQRVAVVGKLKYRNHVPKSMQVESITRLPEANELPQPKDIGPINITDGLSSEEHVRRMRDA